MSAVSHLKTIERQRIRRQKKRAYQRANPKCADYRFVEVESNEGGHDEGNNAEEVSVNL
jgi:hypothetical protein